DRLVFANNSLQNINSNIYVANVTNSANLQAPAATPTASGNTKSNAIRNEPGNHALVELEPRATPEKTRNIPNTISGGVLNGKATSLPRPPYPPAARAVRASGAVSVQVLIDEQGNVVSASAVSGHPLLQAAAVAAARGAKFSPTVLSGQPVKVSGVITYNFVP
ncbi:MAG: TonB family protein, partial [Pyrinomonadaceae bacterium]